jgi:hypothetical protein
MQSQRNTSSMNVVQKKAKQKSTILDHIQSEYCLKRDNFDPQAPSPNIFMTKLELRMKAYYKKFCNSENSIMK